MKLEIKVPEQLDDVIRDAMSRARRKNRSRLYWAVSAVSAASIAAIVLVSANTSPTFASFLKSPLKFINTINEEMYGKLSQPVHLKESKDNLTFIVREIVSDPHRLFIPYTFETRAGMENKLRYKFIDADGNVLLEEKGWDEKGNHISSFPGNRLIAAASTSINEDEPGVYSGHFDLRAPMHYRFTDRIKLEISFSDNPEKVWTYDLVNKPKISEIYEYAVDREFELSVHGETHRLRAEKLTLYPTMTTLLLMDVKTWQNVEFIERMHLEDEHGNRAEHKGDLTEVDSQGNYITRKTFDSLHMHNPQELYLVIEELKDMNRTPIIGEARPTFKVLERVRLR